MSNAFAGAVWWRFDFHTHTPFSQDTPWHAATPSAETLSPEAWLLRYMSAGIDCVAITDHNGGGWIDPLKSAYARMEAARPQGFRELFLFPGVELTVSGGIHLLAIFGRDSGTSKIDALLGQVGYDGTRGDSDTCSKKSLIEVVEIVAAAGGIAIPAHVDCEGKGLLRTGDGRSGRAAIDPLTLRQVLDSQHVFAMELVDPNAALPTLYSDRKCEWTRVLGSDDHGRAKGVATGSRFTWVKMGNPSLDGLRLALLDGSPLSVRRSDDGSEDPNQRHGELLIEAMEVDRAQFAGYRKPTQPQQPLCVQFSPWLSTLIGGRGSGKSTIIQLMRWVFGAGNEMPEPVRKDFENFTTVYDPAKQVGALTEGTRVTVILRRGQSRLRLTRVHGTSTTLEEEANGEWRAAEPGILQTLSVRIFAQKEIVELAAAPEKLPALLDKAPDIAFLAWYADWESKTAKYLRERGEAREVRTRLRDRDRIKGELHELRRQLAVFEEGGHRELLVTYQRVQRQRRVLDHRAKELEALEMRLEDAAQSLEPSESVVAEFDANDERDATALALLREGEEFQTRVAAQAAALAKDARTFRDEWGRRRAQSKWQTTAAGVETEYAALVDRLREEGVKDPGAYGGLLAKRETLEAQQTELDTLEARLAPLDQAAEQTLADLVAHRRELTRRRAEYVAKVLAGNQFVRIDVLAYGRDPAVEVGRFRKCIGREDQTFRADILEGDQGLLAVLYRGLPVDSTRAATLEKRCEELRRTLLVAAAGSQVEGLGKPFQKHLQGLSEEQKDRIRLWAPADSVQVCYRRSGADDWVDVEGGSKGQKSVAVLAFLLASGVEPIVMDQPEDDLDNHVIYDLVVQRIRDQKPLRQLIIATHNPNIVVNGDAEMVLAMDFRGGQCRQVKESTGCLQDSGVRAGICRVLEGGKEAFRKRYERIGGFV